MQQYSRPNEKKRAKKELSEYQEQQRQNAIMQEDEDERYEEFLHEEISRSLSRSTMNEHYRTTFEVPELDDDFFW